MLKLIYLRIFGKKKKKSLKSTKKGQVPILSYLHLAAMQSEMLKVTVTNLFVLMYLL